MVLVLLQKPRFFSFSEKLSHGLNFFNHSLYMNPGAECLKKNWSISDFFFFFFLVPGEDSKRQSYFCNPLRDTTCYWILLHCLDFDFQMYRILYILLINGTCKVRGSSRGQKVLLLTVAASQGRLSVASVFKVFYVILCSVLLLPYEIISISCYNLSLQGLRRS